MLRILFVLGGIIYLLIAFLGQPDQVVDFADDYHPAVWIEFADADVHGAQL